MASAGPANELALMDAAGSANGPAAPFRGHLFYSFFANVGCPVSPASARDCSLTSGEDFDGRLACRALYGLRRPGSELDADRVRYCRHRDCPFVADEPIKILRLDMPIF
jgi:hypothetical protein